MKKTITAMMMAACAALTVQAQGVRPLPAIHVDGKWLVDGQGNHVVLHGVMDTPSAWFNSGRWGWSYDDAGRQRCLDYFEKVFTGLEKAKCTVFRLHLEPAWTNDNGYTYIAYDQQSKDNGNLPTGEADISHFNPTRLRNYMKTLYFPLMKKAMNHGMYVVVRPPGVCPHNLKVGDYYQAYLKEVWDIVTKNDSVLKYPGQISIELANEPVNLRNAQNQDDARALHDFFQPVVDKIRENGFSGIVWAPGTGWQSNYQSYNTYPITGYNIGYAVHDYNGWYGSDDKNISNVEQATTAKINQFRNQVPVVTKAPIIITEVDWSPTKPGTGHYNEHGTWVESNYGTWATGTTSKWGTVFKGVLDHYGNISMTLSGTDCLLDVEQLLKDGSVKPAFGGIAEACGKACMDWYAQYYEVDWPHADLTENSLTVTAMTVGTQSYNTMVGTTLTPQLVASFKDGHSESVVRQVTYTADTEGVVSTTTDGQLKTVGAGTTVVTATYTDTKGNTVTADFTVTATFFPLQAQYISNIVGNGTYTESSHRLRPVKDGEMGWVYATPIDISAYRFLVVKLSQQQTAQTQVVIRPTQQNVYFRSDSIKGQKEFVIDLQGLKYNSQVQRNRQANLRGVKSIGFTGNGSGSVYIKEVLLSNDEALYGHATAIAPVPVADHAPAGTPADAADCYYDLKGRRIVGTPRPGLYIRRGKLLIVK
jgi:hypothetical protein